MTPAPTQSSPATAAAAEPRASRAPVPIWLIVLPLLIFYWGMIYFDRYGGWFDPQVYAPYRSLEQVMAWQPVSGAPTPFTIGKAVYLKPTCVACHQTDGKGTPGQFPPLAGSDWVNEPDPGRLIRIVLNGLNGPIQVGGQAYNNVMVPWKDVLTDEEIAAVLTYVRNEWGNRAPEITPERVKAVRAAIKARSAPFTADELMRVSAAD